MAALKLFIYFLAGFIQWGLAALRTWFIATDKPVTVGIIVFIEEIILVGVTAYVINHPSEWWLLLSGSLGGAIGAWTCLKFKDKIPRRKK